MGFQVFVSHSGRDRGWVERMRADLAGVGVDAYLFEHDPHPGELLAKKIQDAIRRSQVVVVLLTENSAPSPYVQQEVGYALGQKRLVVPLVERRTARDALAMLGGVEYIAFDFAAPEDGLRQLAVHLAGLRERKEREDQIVAMALLVCAVAIIVMSSGTSSA